MACADVTIILAGLSLGCLARERGQSEDSCVAGTVTECITELSAGHASGLALGDDEGWVGALEADSTAVL